MTEMRTPPGMMSQPVPFMRKRQDGSSTIVIGAIVFPSDLNAHDCTMIEAQLNVIKLLAGIAPKPATSDT